MARSNPVRLIAIAFAAPLFFSAGITTANEKSEIAAVIDEAVTSAVTAKVVALNPEMMIANDVSEKEFNRIGCPYSVKTKADLDEVGAILKRAQIVQAEPHTQWGKVGINIRIGIYLIRSDGTVTKLLFETRGPFRGVAYGWLNEDKSVKALNPDFTVELHEWAKNREADTSPICEIHTPKSKR